MWSWFAFFMILHILAVLVAFGPTFAFPLIGAMVGKQPQYSAILTEVIDVIERRMTIPLAIAVPFFGLGLVYTGHFDLWKSEWLIISILLYTLTFFFAVFVQTKNSAALVRSLRDMPPGLLRVVRPDFRRDVPDDPGGGDPGPDGVAARELPGDLLGRHRCPSGAASSPITPQHVFAASPERRGGKPPRPDTGWP